MLEVYGITYDHTTNYGSCFQAYALQQAVRKMRVGDAECSYRLIPIKTTREWRSIKSLKTVILRPLMRLHRRQFVPFEEKHMQFAAVSSVAELPALNETADAFVCGSDVIWNPDFNNSFDAFYLAFARKYKFSYAASFGRKGIGEATVRHIAPLLDDLDSISVRDETSMNTVGQCTDKPARIVADPVLLLDGEDWRKVAQPVSKGEKYIFIYVTHINDTIKQFLDKLRGETKLKVICAVSGPKQALKLGMLQVQRPEQWLRQLMDAEYVVTNSFHATAFSVIFHRKFFTVVHGGKGEGINVRMNDFLNQVGLEDRIFSEIPERIDLGEIDYTAVDGKVGALREESLAFLRENLEAAYRAKMSHSQKE